MNITLISLLISAIACIVSVLTLFHKKSDSSAKQMSELEKRINKLEVDCGIIMERVKNAIHHSEGLSQKLDDILLQINRKK